MTISSVSCGFFFLGAAFFLASTGAVAVDGEYDTSWGDAGRLRIDVVSGDDINTSMFIQPDGKIFMAGTCGSLPRGLCATRLLPNGSFDDTFGPPAHPGRVVIPNAGPSDINDVSAAPHGSGYVLVNSKALRGEFRLMTATGTVTALQTSDIGQGISFPVAIAVQPDGKIVIASSTIDAGFVVSRLGADLQYDTTFGDSAGTKLITFGNSPSVTATTLALQPDGKIVVAGVVDNQVAVARLLANGQLDDDPITGFADSGRAIFSEAKNSYAATMLVDRSGFILLAGAAHPDSEDFFINRLTPSGAQDPAFNYTCQSTGGGISCGAGPNVIDFALGGMSDDRVLAMALQSDGKIVVSGHATRVGDVQYFAVARLRRDGLLDFSFGDHGTTYGRYGALDQNLDEAGSVATVGGSIFVAGYSRLNPMDEARFGIAKMKIDALFADGFGP